MRLDRPPVGGLELCTAIIAVSHIIDSHRLCSTISSSEVVHLKGAAAVMYSVYIGICHLASVNHAADTFSFRRKKAE
jgi:hypothetical protein